MRIKKMTVYMVLLIGIFSQNIFAETECPDFIDETHRYVAFERDVRIYGEEHIDTEHISGYHGRNSKGCEVLYEKELFNDALNMHALDRLMKRKLVSHDETLSDFKISRQLDSVSVTFVEEFVEEYKDDSNSENDYKTEGAGTEIRITFKKEGERWVIVEHTVYNSVLANEEVSVSAQERTDHWENIKRIFPQFNRIERANAVKSAEGAERVDAPMPSEGELIFNRPIRKFKSKEKKAAPSDSSSFFDPQTMEPRAAAKGLSWNWSGKAAADYSDKYAINPNTGFRVYSADCTNFVSQCLLAGGKPERDQGGRKSDDSWYYGWLKITTSYSWAASHNLGLHLGANTNTNFFPTSIYQFDRGDLVFQDIGKNGDSNHTMIITKVKYDENNPDGWVNYHTPNRSHQSIVDIMLRNPNDSFVFGIVGNTYYR